MINQPNSGAVSVGGGNSYSYPAYSSNFSTPNPYAQVLGSAVGSFAQNMALANLIKKKLGTQAPAPVSTATPTPTFGGQADLPDVSALSAFSGQA